MSNEASPPANNYDQIKVIAFDADDTLWVNETYFREVEDKFCQLLMQYETPNNLHQELFKLEMKLLPLYGYGIKGFYTGPCPVRHSSIQQHRLTTNDSKNIRLGPRHVEETH